jgi:predicted RNA polymerase sigma factor
VTGSTSQAALDATEPLAARLDGYHLFHPVRGELLAELGRREQARSAERRALALTGNGRTVPAAAAAAPARPAVAAAGARKRRLAGTTGWG